MPELPEVEIIVTDLNEILKNKKFSGIFSSFKKSIYPNLTEFEIINEKKVKQVFREGKFINILLENKYVLTIHLRMSGRLIIAKPLDKLLKFERTKFLFENISLRFCDQRKFGRVWLCKVDEYKKITGISKLGADPMSDEFSFKFFSGLLNKRKGILKSFLLNQSYISGIGNIYADEACFLSGIRPNKKIEELNKNEMHKLYSNIIKVLKLGIDRRGTSFSDFVDAKGIAGKNQNSLYVYNRKDLPCVKCHEKLQKIKLVGRGTVFCKNCQK